MWAGYNMLSIGVAGEIYNTTETFPSIMAKEKNSKINRDGLLVSANWIRYCFLTRQQEKLWRRFEPGIPHKYVN